MGKAGSRRIGYNPRVLALIKTFGCKVNYADSEETACALASRGWDCAHAGEDRHIGKCEPPQLVVINSCAVTHTAVAKVRRYIRRTRREYPEAKVVVIGCCAGNSEIASELRALGAEVADGHNLLPAISNTASQYCCSARSRRFIKVQDGCDSYCAYCIVPYVRSKWNAPLIEVTNQLKRAAKDGAAEVVLCGVNIGLYREPDIGFGFAKLLGKALAECPDGIRIRLSSIEPEHVSDELLSQYTNPKLCPHLHIPLQSGSERVLKDMGRRYCIGQYAKAVDTFRAALPFGSITTDLLVGFPTETDEDFQRTLESVRAFGFERAHVFRYSQRPGTAAASLKPLHASVTRERESELLKLCAEVADKRWERFIGRSCSVALESGSSGYGEAYQRVCVNPVTPNSKGLRNVKLASYAHGIFIGKAM